MAADPCDQVRADRERHRAEARADAPDWHHDTLDLDPVVEGEVLRERTRGGALHAGHRFLRAAGRSAGSSVRSAPRRVPAGVVVGVLLLAGAGAVSAVASEVPLGWLSGVSQAPSDPGASDSGSGVLGPGETGPSVVVGGGGGAAAPQPAAPGGGEPAAPAGGPADGPAGGPGAWPAGGPPAGPGATAQSRPQERLP